LSIRLGYRPIMRLLPPARSIALLAAAVCGLAGCSRSQDLPAVVREDDPALLAALAYPLATDPDLAGMNRANSALSLPSQDGSLPTFDTGLEFIAAARAEAAALVGGAGSMRRAPEQAGEVSPLPAAARLTAAALAAAAPGGDPACAARASYTMMWAARLPATFPIYPRGATQEAAGTDEGGCALRAVRFVTPVPLSEVVDFYYTRALAAGYSATRALQQGDDRLNGAGSDGGYAVWGRRLPSGNTEVDLVTW
jgi:hypothetical protein